MIRGGVVHTHVGWRFLGLVPVCHFNVAGSLECLGLPWPCAAHDLVMVVEPVGIYRH